MEELEQAIAMLLAEADRLIITRKPRQDSVITVNRIEFVSAIKGLKPFIPKKPSHLVLDCYYLGVSGTKLIIQATDLSKFGEARIEVGASNNASICIWASHLKWLETINHPELTFRFGEGTLEIKYGDSSCKLNGMSGDEFPEFPKWETPIATVKANKQAFTNTFKTVLSCVSSDELKQVLTGVHLIQQGTDLRFETCDGHKMAIDWLPAGITGKLDAIVPSDLISAIAKFADRSETITIEFYKEVCRIILPGITVYSRLIEGLYPQVELLMVHPEHYIKFDPKELIEKVKALRTIEERKQLDAWIGVGDDKLIVKSENDNGIKLAFTIPTIVPLALKKETFRLNSRYLVSILEKMGKKGLFGFGGHPLAPVVFKSEDSSTYFLISPIQTRK